MRRDDMVIFPNIAPYDSIGAVATFGARHFIPMTAFTPAHMAAAFGFAQAFFRRGQKAKLATTNRADLPNRLAFQETLRRAGALEVFCQAILMKKGRTGRKA